MQKKTKLPTMIVTIIEYKGKPCLPIPRVYCKALGLKEGTKITLEVSPDGKTIILRKYKPKT